MIKRTLSRFPVYVLWALAAFVVWSWIFTFLTDTSAAKKLSLYVSVDELQDTELAARLEDGGLPEGIRMIKVHPFSYAMFGDRDLLTADLYIVRASEAAQWRDSFRPLPQGLTGELDLGGGICGIRVYDAAAGCGVYDELIDYSVYAEDFYLFFGAESWHTEAGDGAALWLARQLMDAKAATELCSDTLRVEPIPALPEDFILGMDLSSVLSEEESGVRYRDFDGCETDVFRLLRDCGLSHIRVRVWNDPYDAEGRGYGGGNCDPDRAAEIGRRAAQYGLKLIVDFHYSDFWADPAKQAVPKAWQGMDFSEKTQALRDFTQSTLKKLRSAGADIAMVQLGNETNRFLCGETQWSRICALLQAGSEAVRAELPEALVAVHFSNPEQAGSYREYAARLAEYAVDYDVFASSYYPFWHGTLANLSAVLTEVAEDYGKKSIIMESSYAQSAEDSDFFPNTVGADSAVDKPYPFTVQGQADAIRDLIDTAARIPGSLGVVYWEGAWISVGGASRAENSALWEKYGSGWATSFAGSYDPADAGRWYGGCAVDNQAFFDPTGQPLESLKLFRLLRG